MFAANYPLLSVCLNEVFFRKCLGFKKPIGVDKALKHCNLGVGGTWSASLNRYRSPNFAGSKKLSRYFHAIYRSAETKEKYFQLRRFRRCCKNDNFI